MFNLPRISKADLIKSGERGWIPGPQETEEAFIKRIEKLHHFYENPPQECDQFLTDSDWVEPLKRVQALYAIKPDWIVAHYLNEKLPFYQGAATWILEKEGTRFPLIQLKKRFSKKNSSFRSEILAHEAVHAVRLQFDEPFFEELFAYRTSRNFFRRFFGPLFHRNWEALVFILLFLLPLATEIGRFATIDHWIWDLLFWLPWIYTAGLLVRLLSAHLCMSLAIWKLKRKKIAPQHELSFLLRLTDREIFRIALFSPKKWFKDQKSLRWRQILDTFSVKQP